MTRLALSLAALLWVTPAHAGPIFFAPAPHPEVLFVGDGAWYPTVETFGTGWDRGWLGALLYVAQLDAPTRLAARYTLDGTLVATVDQVVSPIAGSTGMGLVLEFVLPATVTDYRVHELVVTLTLPEDARTYALAVAQPVPEPAWLGLLGAALVALGRWRRARQRPPGGRERP